MSAQAKKMPTKQAVVTRQYVIKSIFVDKYNTVRKRVLLTGCVCSDCGFDFCERNGFPEWADLDDGQKAVVQQAMVEHKKLHTLAENRIVTEAELVQNNLGKPAAV